MRTDQRNALKEMDSLWTSFVQVKAKHPSLSMSLVGETSVSTPKYYRDHHHNFTILFDKPLTAEDVQEWNDNGEWINQSFIVRLYAFLEYHGVVGEINKLLEGHEEVEILRRLRNVFGHTIGYNKESAKHRKLSERIIKHFNLNDHDSDGFTISINTVLEPLFKKAKVYLKLAQGLPPTKAKRNCGEPFANEE